MKIEEYVDITFENVIFKYLKAYPIFNSVGFINEYGFTISGRDNFLNLLCSNSKTSVIDTHLIHFCSRNNIDLNKVLRSIEAFHWQLFNGQLKEIRPFLEDPSRTEDEVQQWIKENTKNK